MYNTHFTVVKLVKFCARYKSLDFSAFIRAGYGTRFNDTFSIQLLEERVAKVKVQYEETVAQQSRQIGDLESKVTASARACEPHCSFCSS